MDIDPVKKSFDNLPDGFWDFVDSDTQEYTHGLHTYPATMICPISRNIIKIMKEIMPINTLLDPFSGSGTVLVEGLIGDIKEIIGNDLNPLARFISGVKTTPIDKETLINSIKDFKSKLDEDFFEKDPCIISIEKSISNETNIADKNGWGDNAEEYLDRYVPKEWKLTIPSFKNMGYWIKPRVLIELSLIKKHIDEITNADVQNFVLVSYSEIIRIVSNRRNGEFKMYRMESDKVISFQPNTLHEFYKKLDQNISKMNDFTSMITNDKHTVSIHSDDACCLQSITDESVDLMITSPPYGDSRTTVAYGEFSKLSINMIPNKIHSNEKNIDKILMGGEKIKNFDYKLSSPTLNASLDIIKTIDNERAKDVFSFYKDLDKAIAAISKKSKVNSYQFWVVGNRTVKKEQLKTDEIIVEFGKQYGLTHICTAKRKISNKVMPSSNSPSNKAGETVTTMIYEYIVVLKKIRQSGPYS